MLAQLIKCRCRHCDGPLEFDLTAIPAGTSIACPHCGLETTLFVPQDQKPKPLTDKPRPPASQQIAIQSAVRPIESVLEEIGGVFYAFGWIGAVISGIVAVILFAQAMDKGDSALPALVPLFAALGMLFQGFVIKTVFRAIAEIIRVLRKIESKK
jgi:hypothetical protein